IAQNHRFQQHVSYKMEVEVDVKTFKYKGIQELTYTNNSPDTLYKVFYHLYNNAFQPGSEMDARLQSITDPDKRMVRTFTKDNIITTQYRISELTPALIGYPTSTTSKQDANPSDIHIHATIMEVKLHKP